MSRYNDSNKSNDKRSVRVNEKIEMAAGAALGDNY
jgi:hypothetical protein